YVEQVMKFIALPCYDRISYLKQCLTYLSNNWGAKDYTILSSIDPSRRTQEVLALFNEYNKYFKEIRSYVNERRLGCEGNILRCVNWAFREGAEYLPYVEDDILVAPDFLKFCEEGYAKYKDDNEIFALCAYSRENPEEKDYYTLHKRDSFMPWGVCFFARNWDYIKLRWQELSFPPIIVNRIKDGKAVKEIYD